MYISNLGLLFKSRWLQFRVVWIFESCSASWSLSWSENLWHTGRVVNKELIYTLHLSASRHYGATGNGIKLSENGNRVNLSHNFLSLNSYSLNKVILQFWMISFVFLKSSNFYCYERSYSQNSGKTRSAFISLLYRTCGW